MLPRPHRAGGVFLRLVPVAVAGLAGGLALALAGGFVLFADKVSSMERPPTPRAADAIVALTGTSARISDAVDLLERGHAARLLITGVHPDTTAQELARASPSLAPMLDCCVDLGYAALNTVGNARETRDWAERQGYRSLIVVTSDYHLPRSLNELRREMPEIDLIPYPVIKEPVAPQRWWQDGGTARLLAGEYAKYIMSMVQLRWRPATALEHEAATQASHPRAPVRTVR